MPENNKLTTVEQFKMLALRAQADSAARIAGLATLVAGGYGRLITVTLPAANWSGRTQKIEHESLLANSGYCYFVYGNINVNADDISLDGQATFQCENVPDIDLIVTIIRFEVETGTNSNVGKVFNLASNENMRDYIDERLGDFYNALMNERPIYFGLCDSDSRAILDSENKSIAGRVYFTSSNKENESQ